MPYLHLTTPTGPIDVHYNISTPTAPSASIITPQLPCILFLHAGYMGQETFEGIVLIYRALSRSPATAQFSDPQLRKQFNLIALDMRAYGSTEGPVGSQHYCPTDSADDVYRFIKALKLSSVHIFGLSIGCTVALELATTHPNLVDSLVLCSPLPPTEPEDIAAGRLEIHQYWAQAFKHDSSSSDSDSDLPLETDKAMLDDVLRGAQQLLFNNQVTRLTNALAGVALKQAIHRRAGSPEKLADSYQVSINWFLERRPLALSSLAKITCPVRLIHCADDIAYPLRHTQEFESQLREAGVADVVLCRVPGPHYGNVINPQTINPILRDVVLSVSRGAAHRHSKSCPSDHQDHHKMTTPFTKQLAMYGYDPHEDDSDSE